MKAKAMIMVLLVLASCRCWRDQRREAAWLEGYEARRAETLQTQQASAVRTSSAVWERVVMERDTSTGELVVTERIVETLAASDTAAAENELFRKNIAVDSVLVEKGIVTQEKIDMRSTAVKTASVLLALFLFAAMLAAAVSLYVKIKRRL